MKKKILKEFYNVRALIYTLLIFSSLLFLLNLKQLNLGIWIYILFLWLLIFVSISEFLFAIKYSGSVYHGKHPLRNLYERMRRHHLYSIILLPVVQYISCAFIIYYVDHTGYSLLAVSAVSVLTYFTLLAYTKIYENDLKVPTEVEEFFDASKYVSFALLTYLFLLVHTMFGIPRSATAVIIGLIHFFYIIFVIWRRDELHLKTLLISLVSFAFVTLFIYFHLVYFPLITETGLIAISTAHVLIIDYIISGLLVRWIEKRLSITAVIEYFLIALIGITLLAVSR